ncbi:uncharacterized protein LOC111042407 [Myzus persicae]|uniref:uncharacterized protein LOC111042407 n=1 Tax=Myzus persicae TaxID=13164 RepID=UPI000B936647|nr:uncharacterized protein LOC111042407 [Myzus persicae]
MASCNPSILSELPEVRPIKLALQISKQIVNEYPLNTFSKWNHMVRVTAYMLRFVYNSNKHKDQISDRQQAELNLLLNSKSVSSNSRLKLLNPFIDAYGLMRVGGRLSYLDASDERRCPIVLPSKGKIVKMIFEQMHLGLLHIGPQGLLANIQLKYWPLRGRSLARATYHRCNICFRVKPNMLHPQMAPILRSRISIQRAFSRTGVDFCEPILIKSGIRRAGCGKRTITENLAHQGIKWHFNPPAAPHFGGIWDAAVKSTKTHLVKMTNNILLTFENLLCRIEAILNSRPLTPLADDPSDFEALTPGHFLVGGPILLPPELDSTSIPQNRLRRYALVRSQMQWFWKRWSKEYLPQIQKRNKWLKPQRNLIVGDLVIVKEDNIPPLKWKLARVLTVHPGNDNVVRVVTIRMGNGSEYQRPVVRFALLPTVAEEETDQCLL